jgi:hypothetical protein
MIAYSGSDGWATFEVPGGEHYLVAVGHVGFIPRSGIVFADRNCEVEIVVTLDIEVPSEVI